MRRMPSGLSFVSFVHEFEIFFPPPESEFIEVSSETVGKTVKLLENFNFFSGLTRKVFEKVKPKLIKKSWSEWKLFLIRFF